MRKNKRKAPKKMQDGGITQDDYEDVGGGYGYGDEFSSVDPNDDTQADSDGMAGGEDYQSTGTDEGDNADYQTDPSAANASTMAPFAAARARQTDALQALKDAQARAVAALQPKQDKSAMWLAIAQGLLSPTRTGSFSESLGNAAGGAAPYEQHYADAEMAGKEKISEIDQNMAQNLYNQASKPPQIIDWYARNPAGAVGKQKAMLVDGTPVPFGEVFTPGGAGGNSMKDKLDLFADPKYGPLYQKYMQMNHPPSQSVTNVSNNVPFESESQKKAADRLDSLFTQADTSRQLAAQLNAVAPYIEKTPDAYFGPGGPGLVTMGKALNQLGFNVGDGLDSASFVQSVMNHLGPAQRIVGSGSSSDRDVALFMSSLPGLANTKTGNQMLVKYYNKLNDYNQKLVRIIRSYAKTHSDFYGIEDLPTEEINKAGRVFSDADLQEMQAAANGKPAGRTALPHANVQEDGDDLVITPGK